MGENIERDGKGKGKAPPPPVAGAAKELGKGAGKSKAGSKLFNPAMVPKVTTAGASQKKIARLTQLHMTHGQQLVAEQESDGHFDGKSLAMKLDRLWGKFMILEPPSDLEALKLELSAHPADASVFVVRLFERFVERSGYNRDEVVSWFGSGGGGLGDKWLDKLVDWLDQSRFDDGKCWRDSARLEAVEVLLAKWFATDAECKIPGGPNMDNDKIKQKQAEMARKFAAAQEESLRREALWAENKPAKNLDTVCWEAASATRWCFGGGGGCFLVRIGDGERGEKLIVKGAQDEGDVIGHELANILGIRTARMRFVSPASSEFEVIRGALINKSQPDEPEELKKLLILFGNLEKTGCPLMVMEFIQGASLQDRRGSEALERGNEDFMEMLGRVVAMDCFMNNWDRTPALRTWPGAGNMGNVMITETEPPEDCEMVAIDQAVQLLCDPKVRVDYYHALRQFHDEVNADLESSSFMEHGITRIKESVRTQAMKWTGDQVKDAENFEKFRLKGEKPSKDAVGIVLEDCACRFLLEGVKDIFSKVTIIRSEFLAQKNALVDFTLSCFGTRHSLSSLLGTEEEDRHLTERIHGSLQFIEDSMNVVESKDLYESTVQATLEKNVVLPGKKFVSQLHVTPNS